MCTTYIQMKVQVWNCYHAYQSMPEATKYQMRKEDWYTAYKKNHTKHDPGNEIQGHTAEETLRKATSTKAENSGNED